MSSLSGTLVSQSLMSSQALVFQCFSCLSPPPMFQSSTRGAGPHRARGVQPRRLQPSVACGVQERPHASLVVQWQGHRTAAEICPRFAHLVPQRLERSRELLLPRDGYAMAATSSSFVSRPEISAKTAAWWYPWLGEELLTSLAFDLWSSEQPECRTPQSAKDRTSWPWAKACPVSRRQLNAPTSL